MWSITFSTNRWKSKGTVADPCCAVVGVIVLATGVYMSSQQARQLLIAANYRHVLPNMQESAACAMEDVLRSR